MMDETSRNLLFLALFLLVIVIVYELYKLKALKKQQNKISEVFLSKKAHLLTHCQSPDCYRCTNNRDLLQAAITKLSYYSLGNDSSGAANDVQNLSKDIRKSLDRLKHPDECVTADQSLTSGSTKSKTSSPVVFKMSGLREQELWSQSDFPALQILDTYFKQIQIEFTNLYKSPLTETLCLWKTNSTSSGKWEIAQLIDQGRKTKAAEFCPLTMEALSKVPYFIRGNVFGDASFSVVHPGTHIATHCGSTNCRIRCHLGLKVEGNDCSLQVGDETCHWMEGEVICFNDAFPHSVHHRGGQESEMRAVFLLDLWHPDITDSQKNVLNYAFSM